MCDNNPIFTDLSKEYPIDDIMDVIKKYQDKAYTKFIDILTKDYGINAESAEQIEKSVSAKVRSEMMERYRFKKPFASLKAIGQEHDPYIFLTMEHTDFLDYMVTALTVPFYQSLGDTIGYKNGNWEFNYDEKDVKPEYTNELISEFISLGGINDLSIVHWRASDDTILYMQTLKVLTDHIHDINEFGSKLRVAYIDAIPLMNNRHPGETTMQSLDTQKNIEWDKLQYNSFHVGAGAAMRSGCIGIFFPGKHNRKKLIALAVECSRITHNSAIAILGSIVAALFTAYALEKIPINHWPHKLLNLFKSKKIDNYMQKSRPHEYHLYTRDKGLFIGQWEHYVNIRFSGITPNLNMKNMKNPVLRFKYLSENFSKGHLDFAGSHGDDSVIMAYDALLESGDVIEKIIIYSILHPGDSDTVGSIALSWFGAYYHSPRNQNFLCDRFSDLEFFDELYDLFGKNFIRMAKIYYYDMYLNTVRKHLRKLKK